MTLAIDGGAPIVSERFPMWPSFDEAVFERVLEPLQTGKVNYWTGPLGRRFEKAFASFCGTPYAISTTNGTSALHTALAALGIGPGDEVICPSYTFIATAFAVLQAGALPVFCDVDRTHTLDPLRVPEKITEKTRAIIVVHVFGVMTDMAPILDIAESHGLMVIEDCAQAIGGSFNGIKAGAVGDAGCFSFCQSKHFTTGGEGGAVVMKERDATWLARSFRDHGYEAEERFAILEREARLTYVHPRIGFNYRMTEIQSAIGLVELERFENWNLKNRQRNGRYLAAHLNTHPVITSTPTDTDQRTNAYWWAPFTVNIRALNVTIQQVVSAIAAEGVPAQSVPWPEIYLQDAFQKRNGFGKLNYPFNDPAARNINYEQVLCPTARDLGQCTIAFPVHPVYNLEHMDQYIAAFHKVIAAYSR
ncbi:DegT/DnrJ/EryC1/StrS family aminotransferase [Novosphingobium terrae]|uniref:DegT/DnrJ/EryC1/StrS family aminotransferase n=1 Tax=Novosphingobium terrae TaxID=2726189 RepID=UPI001981662F|nr:DegT/DnrJ/EryC1/StrS family aminotransferase [Novosphingobium terrae]